jgi:hypothetical protein
MVVELSMRDVYMTWGIWSRESEYVLCTESVVCTATKQQRKKKRSEQRKEGVIIYMFLSIYDFGTVDGGLSDEEGRHRERAAVQTRGRRARRPTAGARCVSMGLSILLEEEEDHAGPALTLFFFQPKCIT